MYVTVRVCMPTDARGVALRRYVSGSDAAFVAEMPVTRSEPDVDSATKLALDAPLGAARVTSSVTPSGSG